MVLVFGSEPREETQKRDQKRMYTRVKDS